MTLKTPDDSSLWDAWMSQYHLPALTVADELQLFDIVAQAGPLTVDALALRLQMNVDGVRALAKLLASLGWLDLADGNLSATAATVEFLLPGSPGYWGGVLTALRHAPHHRTIREALRRTSDARREGLPADNWRDGKLTPTQASALGKMMHSHSIAAARGVAHAGVLRGRRTLLDIGGGQGTYSVAIAEAHPEIVCTVADLPGMCDVASAYIRQEGLQDRVKTLPMDFFRETPSSKYDAILLSNVLHDWDDRTNLDLLERMSSCVGDGGVILIHEMVAEERPEPTVAGFSLMMYLATYGRQYSEAEIAGFLQSAGFEDIGVLNTHRYFRLICGRRR